MRSCLLLLVCCLVPVVGVAAPPENPELKMVGKINKSINDGVQYLRNIRNKTTHWESFWIEQLTGMEGGITALATLSLLNCGIRADDADVAEPLKYLRKLPQQKTYVVGLVNMVLAEARNPIDLPLIQANVAWLEKTAVRSGNKLVGWSYPNGPIEQPDASNTQYALLGLYAAKQAGAKINDQLWADIQKMYLDGVKIKGEEAHWFYAPDFGRPSFSMTVAGVSGLLIARMGLEKSQQDLNPETGVAKTCGVYPDAEAVRKGMNFIGDKFAFANAINAKSTFYNVYGIERVGRLSGQRFIGKSDWYREGCDYLTPIQKVDGSWTAENDTNFRGVHVISTSFALLFLSKGRSPVLISKLAHGDYKMDGKVLTERGGNPNIVGWNRKHSDAKNLTDFCSKELFKNINLGWQTYDPRRKEFGTDDAILAEAGLLVESPILYITGHEAPKLDEQQKKLLKKYLQEGGFVIAEACCGSKEFAQGMKDLLAERNMFPEQDVKPVSSVHALWKSHFLVPATDFPKLECMDLGCRTVLVLSSEPLAGFWEERKYMPETGKEAKNRGEKAFQLAANIVAYATGKEPPQQRLAQRILQSDKKVELAPRNGFVQPVQIRLDEAPPAEAAMRNLSGYLRDNAKLDIVVQKMKPMSATDDDLFKFKFLYMHGRKAFTLDDEAAVNIRVNLQSGGMLLADACCGSEAFDTAFRKFATQLFPDAKLEAVPTDDPLYSEKLNRVKIDTVERREKAGNATDGKDAGFEKLPPKLEGIKVDGRWVLLYSRYDIGCALEGHKSSDCLGHTPDSAKKLAAAAVLYSLKR